MTRTSAITRSRMNRHRAFGWAAIAAVAAALVLGFVNLGGRGKQRALRLDERRSRDLARVAVAIDGLYRRDKKLPAQIGFVQQYEPGLSLRDPEGNAYEYYPTAGAGYQLCAVFAFESKPTSDFRGRQAQFNTHPAGRHCFDLVAPQSLFP